MRSVQSGILDTGCSEAKHRAYRDFALTGDLAAEVDDATHAAKSLNFGAYPEWNPFGLSFETEMAEGKGLHSCSDAE